MVWGCGGFFCNFFFSLLFRAVTFRLGGGPYSLCRRGSGGAPHFLFRSFFLGSSGRGGILSDSERLYGCQKSSLASPFSARSLLSQLGPPKTLRCLLKAHSALPPYLLLLLISTPLGLSNFRFRGRGVCQQGNGDPDCVRVYRRRLWGAFSPLPSSFSPLFFCR